MENSVLRTAGIGAVLGDWRDDRCILCGTFPLVSMDHFIRRSLRGMAQLAKFMRRGDAGEEGCELARTRG